MSIRMTRKALRARRVKFMARGAPKFIRVYDNGGLDAPDGTCDRYTVVFTGRYTHLTCGEHWVLGMSGAPFWPQGVCMHCGYKFLVDTLRHVPGQPVRHGCWPPPVGGKCHLGVRIRFGDLPADCRKAVTMDYEYLWDLTTRVHPAGSDDEPPVVIVPGPRRREK